MDHFDVFFYINTNFFYVKIRSIIDCFLLRYIFFRDDKSFAGFLLGDEKGKTIITKRFL